MNKFRCLFVEGCDLSGKSTLVNRLTEAMMARRMPFSYVHYGLLPEDWDYDSDYKSTITPGKIFDRFIDSELVYGKVLRGAVNSKFTEEREKSVRAKMAQVGSVVVYCRAPAHVILDRARTRGEDLVKEHQLASISEAYEELYGLESTGPFTGLGAFERHGVHLPMLVIDTSTWVPDEIIEDIVDSFEWRLDGQKENTRVLSRKDDF